MFPLQLGQWQAVPAVNFGKLPQIFVFARRMHALKETKKVQTYANRRPFTSDMELQKPGAIP